MADPSHELYESSQVESAIITAGPLDLDLAHGAGVVANPDTFSVFTPVNHIPTLREVRGVTALSLNARGEITFRTATFGLRDAGQIAQIDELGTSSVLSLKVVAEQASRSAAMVGSRLMREACFSSIQDRGNCTLGGAIVHVGTDAGILETKPFITTALDEHLSGLANSRLGKMGTKIHGALSFKARRTREEIVQNGGNPEQMRRFGAYALFTATAQKRDDALVVDRPFRALL